MPYSGPTEEYRDLSQHPEKIQAWTNEELLKHFLDTRLMIETDTGMPTNSLRMGFVFQVDRIERAEILRRMKRDKPSPLPEDELKDKIIEVLNTVPLLAREGYLYSINRQGIADAFLVAIRKVESQR